MAPLTKEKIAPDPADVALLSGVAIVLQAQPVTHLGKRFLRFVSHDVTPG
jgi:hypothetical protein